MVERFLDRTDAGKQLGEALARFAKRPEVLVLALPRGGVPVAFEVAKALEAPLDVFVVRKLGTPGNEELAMGAIASGGIRVLNQNVVGALHIPPDLIDEAAARELEELERRERVYRKGRAAFDLRGRTVIVIDDGIATGSTMRAAIKALKTAASRIVVAVPTVAFETAAELRPEVDELVTLMTPTNFYAVGQWYEDFSQTTDSEVIDLLERANRPSKE